MTTLYEKLGGKEAISKVVDHFYDKVLADETVNHFFENTDMEKQRRHQTQFISWAVGGLNQYSGRSMEKAHEGLNLQEEHFTAIANHLASSLQAFQVEQGDINQVLDKVASMKEQILHH
ncbi:group I truncated hemoglobin [Bacillus taeanensis]|uniref:Group 1 truncated hemoglobin n=1 Tax=Bacillus taeanensis TaxID=273032 RepID=A0A366XT92_9BACI|nr:group 1 truncated hemoglobin [Bacillus taeanensis]RBW68365.1 group 1 truncated hemoglobin [Bacillus taeanensis]